jgi:transposase-like protein
MAKGTARDLQKEAAWRRRLRQHTESGQSVRAWCRRHEVTETAFYWWRKELARRDAESQTASFVPIHVAEDRPEGGDSQIEIVLADGRCVRLTGPVNREMLTAVLDVLASASSVEAERRAC